MRLVALLTDAGREPATPLPRPQLNDLPSAASSELFALYSELGGLQEAPTLRPGAWDLSFSGKLVVELDEELHFNRYRALTLESSWATNAPWAAVYREHCVKHETECLRAGSWGRRWTNASSAKMFSGGPEGDLDGDGAPRWKQRALYDGLKDATLLLPAGPQLARVATHDSVDGVRLGSALDGLAVISPTAARAFVEVRTAT